MIKDSGFIVRISEEQRKENKGQEDFVATSVGENGHLFLRWEKTILIGRAGE